MRFRSESIAAMVLAFVVGAALWLLIAPDKTQQPVTGTDTSLERSGAPSCASPDRANLALDAAAIVAIAPLASGGAGGKGGALVDGRSAIRAMPGDDPFFRFYRDFSPAHATLRAGLYGSGFFVSPNGVILTSAHLVRNADRVSVTLADGRKLAGDVLGLDLLMDLAVIKINGHHFPIGRLGNEVNLSRGDHVLAIGESQGHTQDVAPGMVTAMGKSTTLAPFIRTSARVNPRDSGGPLLDSCGRVVGVNAEVFTSPSGDRGLSLAIPINVALDVKRELTDD
jgi:serine protease Do